jgi:hypothetical protein
LTVELREDCRPAEVPHACSVRIPVFDPEFFVPWLFGEADADAAGNLYLAGNLRGTAHVAPDVVLTSDSLYEGAERVFLAKYDAQCNFEWVRWVGGNERPIVLIGMDVAPDGTVALTTNMYADAAGNSSAEMTLRTFGPDGEPGFSVNSPEGNSLWVTNLGHTVHYGDDGTLAVSGLRSLCLELDPGEDGLCVARLDANGSPLFARALGGAQGAGVMLGAEGELYAAGLTARQGIVLSDGSLTGPGPQAYVVKFAPDGATSWLSVTADVASDVGLNWTQGFVHVDRDGNLLAAWHEVGWGELTRGLANAFRLDASGAPLSQHELAAATGEGASDMVFSALRDGTLVSAVRLSASTEGVPSTTTLTHWDRAGVETHRIQRQHERVGSVLRLGVSPADQLVLTSLEGGGVENNQQTALLVEKF